MKNVTKKPTVCILGLGYVGLPLAEAFSKYVKVIGFDTDFEKIKILQKMSAEIGIIFSDDQSSIKRADFVIICVPTPLTKSLQPDLSHLKNAAEMVGANLKRGATVIIESTVYPGVTEEILLPILEHGSCLKAGPDFKVAYSPERINPGDKEHTIEKINKIVAGMDEETTNLVAELYRKITPRIFMARSIMVAEAAKVIENIQRDLNIALMNELAIIFAKLGLDTDEVLDAAATKWNFNRYNPGLVGGHCIPVDPHYLVHRARELGYHPQVILAGRAINDHMPKYVAEMTVKAINEQGKVIKGSRVLILGLTYKEDVPDIRESPAAGIITELKEYGIHVLGFDPLLDTHELERKFKIVILASSELSELEKNKVDCVLITVAHTYFRKLSIADLKKIQNEAPILVDIRRIFSREEAKKAGFLYCTL